MSILNQFWIVFTTIFRNNLKKTKGLGEKKSHKIISLIMISIGAAVLLGYYVFYVLVITKSSFDAGINDKIIYLFIAMAQ
ncbi:MAG: hypothetical protein ACOCWI_04235, partial [Bacillota bacterium]